MTKQKGKDGDAKIVAPGKILALAVECGSRGQNWALRRSLCLFMLGHNLCRL